MAGLKGSRRIFFFLPDEGPVTEFFGFRDFKENETHLFFENKINDFFGVVGQAVQLLLAAGPVRVMRDLPEQYIGLGIPGQARDDS